MPPRTTYQKLAIYVSREVHLELKLAAISEHRSLSDFTEELLWSEMNARREPPRLKAEPDEDQSG